MLVNVNFSMCFSLPGLFFRTELLIGNTQFVFGQKEKEVTKIMSESKENMRVREKY